MAILDIYKGVWVTLFGPRSVGTTVAENPLVINDDGSLNVNASVSIGGNPVTDGSGVITLGGTAQNLFSGTTPSNGFGVYNPDATEDLWVAPSTTAAANGQGSIRVAANGGWYETPPNMKPSSAVSIIGATTNHKFTAYRW